MSFDQCLGFFVVVPLAIFCIISTSLSNFLLLDWVARWRLSALAGPPALILRCPYRLGGEEARPVRVLPAPLSSRCMRVPFLRDRAPRLADLPFWFAALLLDLVFFRPRLFLAPAGAVGAASCLFVALVGAVGAASSDFCGELRVDRRTNFFVPRLISLMDSHLAFIFAVIALTVESSQPSISALPQAGKRSRHDIAQRRMAARKGLTSPW
jgi:hypothetical protein